MRISLNWGLQPPETATGAWGARAIYRQPDGIDLLWDRQSSAGEDEEVVKWLKKKGLQLLREKLMEEWLAPSEDRVVMVKDGPFTIAANPRSSYGYIYIGAWKEAR